jgi:hypothetical protein
MGFLFDQPLVCRIHVCSSLPKAELSQYVMLTIHALDRPECPNGFLLSGKLADQAALVGLVNTLYSLESVILSIDCCLEESSQLDEV